MKFLIIGHTVVDHIEQKGNTIIRPGGIYYSVSGIQKAIDKDDEIYLSTFMDEKYYNLFSDELDRVNKKFIEWKEQITHVYLTKTEGKERSEKYDFIENELKIELNDLLKFDGILLNMISGFDVSLEQLKKIRRAFNKTIYLDVHSLARGVDKNFKREFRTIPKFMAWAENVDVIQTNENEFKCLSNETDERKIIDKVLNCGVKYLIITLGSIGARVYFKNNNETNSIFLSANKIKDKELIGCGDIFGSVFFYNYIKKEKRKNILQKANKAASTTKSLNSFYV